MDESVANWESADLYFDSDYAVEDYYDPEITSTTWEPVNGLIRGLLCTNCNRALGLFKDMPERLIKAAAYLLENNRGRYIYPKL